jgi:hypothetical protein
MTAKKAVKRLTRVEALLSKVVDQCAGNGHRVKELLDAAKKSVVRARVTFKAQASPKDSKKSFTKTKKRLLRGLRVTRGKRHSLAPQNR